MKLSHNKAMLLLIAVCACLYTSVLHAQAPQTFPYQSVLRDAAGNLIANQNVSLRFSILSGGASGTLVYQETQNALTNNLGLFDVNIGQGTVTSGTFIVINWGSGSKYLKIELDANGGSNYVVMDNAQLLSVPYALHSNTSNSTNNAHYIGESYGGGIVFYVYDNGQHGLIAAVNDTPSSPTNDGVAGSMSNASLKLFGSGIGAGAKNTLLMYSMNPIVNNNIPLFGPPEQLAMLYSATSNGVTYSDWYIPSLIELQLLYNQRASVGGFVTNHVSFNIYCSSTSYPLSCCSYYHCINFTTGALTYNNTQVRLRLIRSF